MSYSRGAAGRSRFVEPTDSPGNRPGDDHSFKELAMAAKKKKAAKKATKKKAAKKK
ncbi:MAG: hypothetical protein FJ362_01385 [Gemmatimonadetes bacterium]|nr:hypothetical protein [Gemmatimonadota bacterium]